MKRFSWIVVLPLAALAVIFAVMNRTPVELDLWPLPWRIEAAAYLILLGSLAIGMLAGLLLAWLTGSARRRRMRQYVSVNERQAAEIRDLRKQLAEAKRIETERMAADAALSAPAVANVPAPLSDAAPRPPVATDRH